MDIWTKGAGFFGKIVDKNQGGKMAYDLNVEFTTPILPSPDLFGDQIYIIDIAEEIRRVLITKKGSIPMNPEYGSDLYKLRDRTLNDETRLKAISYAFEAIDRWVDRVTCKKVDVVALSYDEFKLRIEVEPA